MPTLSKRLVPCTVPGLAPALAAVLAASILTAPASAQDAWSPFKEGPARSSQKKQVDAQDRPRPAAGSDLPGASPETPSAPYQRPPPRGSAVERMDLDPVIAPDASGLPLELWRGLDMAGLEAILGALELPPRSPTLHGLWRRMLLSSAVPPAGAPAEHFTAVRLEALYRSGLLAEMGDVATGSGSGAQGPVIAALMARKDIGLGDAQKGCDYIKSLSDPRSGLPERLRGEAQLLVGYCAAVAGDRNGAGLAASLAREEGLEAELPLAILGGFSEETKPRLVLPKRMLLLDYRFLELLGPVNARQLVERAEPALLAVLAGDTKADPHARIAAAEAALRENIVAPERVAETYREVALPRREPGAQVDADPAMWHASAFAMSEQASTPTGGTAALQGLLRDARRGGFGLQMGQVVATRFLNQAAARTDTITAETAVEALLAAGRIPEARAWAAAEQNGLPHWVALIDVVDPARTSWRPGSLAVIEDMALRSRLSAEVLHRLATVLDALDIDVPVPLWDAAGRAPQPKGGYLPETGVLAELAQGATRREPARVVLLVMRALGPNGPDGANILPLGDSIRALRKIGLEAEARRLALEALMPVWPRFASQ